MNLLSGVEQDFHRPQKSPGAYEWWHFDGTDNRSGYSFSIQFHAGNLFSAYYQDSLKTYWEKTKSPLVEPSQPPQAPNPSTHSVRSPLRQGFAGQAGQVPISNPPVVSPPNPLDYCGVSFRLFHKGAMTVESLQEFSQKSLKASDKNGAVLLGPNRFNWDQRGDPPSYVLTVQAPLHGGRTTVRARLFFTPHAIKMPNLSNTETPKEIGTSTHTWILAAPWCHVEGTLEWVNPEGEPLKEVAFVGTGYHDHHLGTVPLDRFVKAWHWGHARLGGEDLVYSALVLNEKEEATQTFLLSADGTQARLWRANVIISKNRRNFFWLPYQPRMEFPGAQGLRIHHRHICGDGPVQLFFEDNVRWTVEGKAVEGQGLSNYLYPPRLSNRFFFPLLKGKSLIIKLSDDTGPLPPASDDVSTTRPAL